MTSRWYNFFVANSSSFGSLYCLSSSGILFRHFLVGLVWTMTTINFTFWNMGNGGILWRFSLIFILRLRWFGTCSYGICFTLTRVFLSPGAIRVHKFWWLMPSNCCILVISSLLIFSPPLFLGFLFYTSTWFLPLLFSVQAKIPLLSCAPKRYTSWHLAGNFPAYWYGNEELLFFSTLFPCFVMYGFFNGVGFQFFLSVGRESVGLALFLLARFLFPWHFPASELRFFISSLYCVFLAHHLTGVQSLVLAVPVYTLGIGVERDYIHCVGHSLRFYTIHPLIFLSLRCGCLMYWCLLFIEFDTQAYPVILTALGLGWLHGLASVMVLVGLSLFPFTLLPFFFSLFSAVGVWMLEGLVGLEGWLGETEESRYQCGLGYDIGKCMMVGLWRLDLVWSEVQVGGMWD